MTADSLKDIEDVEVGDYVLAENPETGEQEYKEVVNTYTHEKDVIVHIYVGDEEIETTREHPFYVEETRFVQAGSLKPGDILRLADGRNLEVREVETEHLSEPVYVYNFEVEDYHTYYVSGLGVLVHNMCSVDPNSGIPSGSSSVPGPLKNHSIVTGRNGSLKAVGVPDSSVDLYSDDGRLLQRRFYGEDGKATLDVDFSHGNGDGTHTFPHIHTWDWTNPNPRQ